MIHRSRWLIPAVLLLASGAVSEAFIGLDGKLVSSAAPAAEGSASVTPETSLPEELLNAIAALRGRGLSDPTGGELHRLRIKVGDTGKPGMVEKEAPGWITPGSTQAVVIDGLTYTFLEDLGTASLADLPERQPRDGSGAKQVDQANIALPALLYLLGETDEAERRLENLGISSDSGIALYNHLAYRYKQQVAQCLVERSDLEARAWAENLVSVVALRNANPVKFREYSFGAGVDPEKPEQILRDATRRVEHPKSPPDLEAIKQLEQTERFPALIEALDEVSVVMPEDHSTIEWSQDKLVSAIIAEGEPIIPTLLDTLEKDERLTRTIQISPGFMRPSIIFTVRTAAWAALTSIWPMAGTVEGELAPDKVDRLRLLWERTGKLTPPERWLEVLRDDAAGAKGWLAAAQGLTRLTPNPSNAAPTSGEPPAMAGAPLKARYEKEITQLLSKRIHESAGGSARDRSELQQDLQLAHCLALWEPAQALPILQEVSRRAKEDLAQEASANIEGSSARPGPQWPPGGGPGPRSLLRQRSGAPSFPEFTAYSLVINDRLTAKDESAVPDFVDFLKQVQPGDIMSFRTLDPLRNYPDNLVIQAAGADYLARFVAILAPGDEGPPDARATFALMELSRSYLIASPAYRQFAAGLLASHRPLGTAQLKDSGKGWRISVKIKGGGSSALTHFQDADIEKLTKDPVDITLGDYLAQEIDAWDPTHRFNILGPEADRIRAREELAKWLLDPSINWQKVMEKAPRD